MCGTSALGNYQTYTSCATRFAQVEKHFASLFILAFPPTKQELE